MYWWRSKDVSVVINILLWSPHLSIDPLRLSVPVFKANYDYDKDYESGFLLFGAIAILYTIRLKIVCCPSLYIQISEGYGQSLLPLKSRQPTPAFEHQPLRVIFFSCFFLSLSASFSKNFRCS